MERVTMGSANDCGAMDIGVQLPTIYEFGQVDRSSMKLVGGKTGAYLQSAFRRPEVLVGAVIASTAIGIVLSAYKRSR